jgi:hypothetical protein
MNLFYKIIGVWTIVNFAVSCSLVSTCPENKNYQIDYSSGGGFTGIESGMTIRCDGSVKFLEQRLNSSRTITDSTMLNATQLKTFNKLMKSKGIFDYKNEYKGNYTAHMTFSQDTLTNHFSFNPSNIPKDMPVVINNFIAEIKNISNHK